MKMSLSSHAKRLIYDIRNPDFWKEIEQIYKQQDLWEVYNSAILTSSYYSQDEIKIILQDRNIRWMKKLPAMLRGSPACVSILLPNSSRG